MAVTTNYTMTTILTDVTANSITAGYQGSPDVSGLSNGGYVVAYTTYVVGAADYPALDFYDVNGNISGTARLPYTGDIEVDGGPKVTELANGTILVTWNNTASSDFGLWGRIYNPDGSAVSSQEMSLVNDDTDFANPDITALNDGGFVLFFEDTNSDQAIVKIFDASGNSISGDIYIEDMDIGSQSNGTLTALADGGFAVAFTSNVGLGEIYTRSYDADGTARSTDPILVDNIGVNLAPAIAGMQNGQYAMVYSDTDLLGELASTGVKLIIFNADGTQAGAPIHVNSPTILASETDPDISVLDSGLILVTWTTTLVGLGGNIMGRVFDENGNPVAIDGSSLEFVITDDLSVDTHSTVAALINGGFAVAWEDDNSDGSSGGISHQVSQLTRVQTSDGAGDTMLGYHLKDIMYGNGGDDMLIGGLGADELYGGADNDGFCFEAGDIVVGEEMADGGAGTDSLILVGETDGDFNFQGTSFSSIEQMTSEAQADVSRKAVFTMDQFGDNQLAMDFDVQANAASASSDTIVINLGTASAMDLSAWTFSDWDASADTLCLFGSSNDDFVTGSIMGDLIKGLDGDDDLSGGLGDDDIHGGANDDLISGGAGDDVLNGNSGNDIINGGTGDDAIMGGTGVDLIHGGDGADNIQGNNQNDTLYGEAGNDSLNGGGGHDVLDGGLGDDTLIGGANQDILHGGEGNDSLKGNSGGDDLFGGAGNDIVNGGGGNDDLNGGSGADTFVMNIAFGTDRIYDFEDGTDLVDFSGNGLANEFADVMAAASQVGDNVRIELNANNTLIIENFDLGDMDASDFIF